MFTNFRSDGSNTAAGLVYKRILDNSKVIIIDSFKQQSTESVRIVGNSRVVLAKTMKAVTEIRVERQYVNCCLHINCTRSNLVYYFDVAECEYLFVFVGNWWGRK